MCNAIAESARGTSAFFVTKLKSGIVAVSYFQLWEGYALLIAKNHVEHLGDLQRIPREDFLNDMATLGKAVKRAFNAERINYAILGNEVSHLHAHVIPRFGAKDPIDPREPIWIVPKAQREAQMHITSPSKLDELKRKLRHEITGH